jgi:hypothetical protein
VNITAWAWNPYDTDSSATDPPGGWSSSPERYWAPQAPPRRDASSWQGPGDGDDRWDDSSRWYLPDGDASAGYRSGSRPSADDYGWGDVYTAPLDTWSDSQRWRPARDGEARGHREPAPDSAWRSSRKAYPDERRDAPAMPLGQPDAFRPRSLYDDFSAHRRRLSQGGPDAPMPAGRGDSRASRWQAPDRPSVVERRERYNGYEFRYDPSLGRPGGDRRNGWEFRPLTGREQERMHSQGRYPQIDERDYLPRGPWRSYEDEGTAFGYHSERPGSAPNTYRDLQ